MSGKRQKRLARNLHLSLSLSLSLFISPFASVLKSAPFAALIDHRLSPSLSSPPSLFISPFASVFKSAPFPALTHTHTRPPYSPSIFALLLPSLRSFCRLWRPRSSCLSILSLCYRPYVAFVLFLSSHPPPFAYVFSALACRHCRRPSLSSSLSISALLPPFCLRLFWPPCRSPHRQSSVDTDLPQLVPCAGECGYFGAPGNHVVLRIIHAFFFPLHTTSLSSSYLCHYLHLFCTPLSTFSSITINV